MARAGERYQQKSGVLHFLPEDEIAELPIKIINVRGPPEEFYVELTEIQAEGPEGKRNPPQIIGSGCCLIWLLADTIPDDAWQAGPSLQPDDGAFLSNISQAASSLGTSAEFKTTLVMEESGIADKVGRKQHLAAVPSENEAATSSNNVCHMRSEKSDAKSEARTEARSEARSECRSEALEGEDDNFSCEHWRDKVIEAFYCNGSAEEQAEATAFDWLMHCLALTWKIIFLIVPPPSLLGAYPSFFCSLIGIGLVTVVINDAASLLGCSVGMADDLTAITLVALGTSLPDTLASRTAAISDEHADNSIGNITGSNTVNVLLGMGISWTIGSIYWAFAGVTDEAWRIGKQ
eukprot:g9975.t1